MPGALDKLVVLDLTSHLSGPYAAMMLAPTRQFGAPHPKVHRKSA
jgi:crotonobetainyl-CoA:carnitine CoA-transferase CaiB-like acyl-CoA transferase